MPEIDNYPTSGKPLVPAYNSISNKIRIFEPPLQSEWKLVVNIYGRLLSWRLTLVSSGGHDLTQLNETLEGLARPAPSFKKSNENTHRHNMTPINVLALSK